MKTMEITGIQDVVLKCLSDAMAEDMARNANDPRIHAYLRDIFPFPYSLKDATDFIDLAHKSKRFDSWAITYRNTFAGAITLIPGRHLPP
jgi:[ribosomal protein S5]-alanine N-acetyltransferase